MSHSADHHRAGSWQRAVWNGLRCRCPNCGEGRLFARYLEPVEHCPVCGEEYADRYQVGLLLPFLVITVIGHLMIFAVLEMGHFRVAPLLLLAIVIPIVLILTLLLLPPVKGALTGILWYANLTDEPK